MNVNLIKKKPIRLSYEFFFNEQIWAIVKSRKNFLRSSDYVDLRSSGYLGGTLTVTF